MNNFEEIINAMEDMVENSWSVPLSGGKSVIDSEKILEFIDDMRTALPEELKRSRQIIAQRDDVISRARNEAEAIIAAANAQAQKMVSSQEVYRLAQQKANEIVTDAQNKSREMAASVANYCDSMLEQCESTLTTAANEVGANVAAIRETRKNLKKR